MAVSAHSLLLAATLLILSIVVVSDAAAQSLIKMLPERNLVPDDDSRARADKKVGLFCDSWRLSVETNNAGAWSAIPGVCISYVEDYVTSDKFLSDLEVAVADSLAYAETVEIVGDGFDVWVSDIDDTLLNSLSYYQQYGFK